MVATVTQRLDFLMANQIAAALEQRLDILRSHIDHGVQDDLLDAAILDCLRADDWIRAEFRFPRETFDPAEGSIDPPRDVPLALDSYWNRGA